MEVDYLRNKKTSMKEREGGRGKLERVRCTYDGDELFWKETELFGLDGVVLCVAMVEYSTVFPTYSMSRMSVRCCTMPLSRPGPGRGECWSPASFIA